MRPVVFFLSLSFLSSFALAQEASVSADLPSTKHRYFTELNYQVHSLPMAGSQMIGPAFAFKVNQQNSVGSRFLFSPEVRDERRVSVFWRMSFGRKYYHWIVEPHYSYLWREKGNFATTGLSAGMNFNIRQDLLMGLLVGAEQPGPAFPFGPIWSRPQIILLTQFEF